MWLYTVFINGLCTVALEGRVGPIVISSPYVGTFSQVLEESVGEEDDPMCVSPFLFHFEFECLSLCFHTEYLRPIALFLSSFCIVLFVVCRPTCQCQQ